MGDAAASTALALLLRGGDRRTVDEGLHAESAVYSTLQAGPEFAAWRAGRRGTGGGRSASHEPGDERSAGGQAVGEAVALARHDDRLEVTLTRPHVHNALDTAMRDQLVDAFRLVALDPSITAVHLTGAGPSFCAGGDLTSSTSRSVTAHLVRSASAVGHPRRVRRVTAHLHGSCLGSGIALPVSPHRRSPVPARCGYRLASSPGPGARQHPPSHRAHRTARLA